MNGRKVFSNEKRLFEVVGIAWVVWTGCCVLVLVSVFREFDAEVTRHQYPEGSVAGIVERTVKETNRLLGEPPRERFPHSKSEAFWAVLLGWALVGGSVTYGGYFAFWRAKYRVDYEGSVIEIAHSWARKQLFVDGELQDERADFDYRVVDLHGRIKRGDANGKQVRVSFARFGSSTPICVVIDNCVVFRG